MASTMYVALQEISLSQIGELSFDLSPGDAMTAPVTFGQQRRGSRGVDRRRPDASRALI